LFDVFARLDDGRAREDVRILQFGDSHTASDFGVGVVRHVLQTRFGEGGRGFVSLGRPWKWYAQDGVRGGMTQEFEASRLRRLPGSASEFDGDLGLLGVAIETTRGGARAWTDVTARSSRIELAFLGQPAGGSFDLFVDGAYAGRVATRSEQRAAGFFALDVADAPHSVEVRALGDGAVRLFGMTLDRSEAGVVVDTLGINGAEISTPLRWNQDHFSEQLRHAAPDLVVLAYGTNEALEPALSDDEYERKLVELVGRISRAMPSTACLLLGPPDLARHSRGQDDWRTLPRLLEIVAVQRKVAEAAGCAFYDQLSVMGGPGSIAAWAVEPQPRAMRDRVHLTRGGYSQLATSFTSDVLRAYDEWRAERGLAPVGPAKATGVASR
jgi:lysophospholipase L1-like esterase